MSINIDIDQHGPGFSVIRFSGIVDTVLLGCNTPVTSDSTELRYSFVVRKFADDAVTSRVGAAFIDEVTQQVIEELICLAKEMREAARRGDDLGLNDDEIAFYDALAQNESARDFMGDEKLRVIAHELLKRVKSNVTVDWMHRDSARAKIRVLVKGILNVVFSEGSSQPRASVAQERRLDRAPGAPQV